MSLTVSGGWELTKDRRLETRCNDNEQDNVERGRREGVQDLGE